MTFMRVLMVECTVIKPFGILYDVLVKVASFIFPSNFVILDCEGYFDVPIIYWEDPSYLREGHWLTWR